jgi:uncharacterized protein (DUF362 family)/NAD-dependent dihydropyrimidine dehydrogenase PreA subunit
MDKVFIDKATYDPEVIKPIVEKMLDSKGPDWIKTGTRVLVKPNLLLPSKPEEGIVTHPLITRCVAEYLLDKGAEVQVSDSPGIGNFHRLIRETGYAGALNDLDVKLKAFDQSVKVDIGEPFGSVEIARDAVEADVVINLAKLKTHAQMYLTLGVKNIFGTVVGLRKPEWHMRTGVDRRMFARLLVQIHQAVSPDFTIVDGIIALEGQGPGKSGHPRELGLLVGGASGYAVDKTICTLLDLNSRQLLTCEQSQILEYFDGAVHVNGNIEILDDFRFPELNSLSLGSDGLNRFMRKHAIQKPVVDNDMCKLCGECWKICPANCIGHNIRGIFFDYDPCIRCYCCLEVCLHGAIRAREPMLGKVWRRLTEKNQSRQA